ncbi:response regulator transcription factor [Flavobacterium terrigena]|uniref:DNA-binding response regulator, NarL/FixJ family, contains REC and HTH domains n=1 Tax=Flavobacterium terrigena TaxID=402734 RepID=A0A1H6R0E4_9FLAO|nr:response regulator transcription factor [Flavobacterium terrigena]SEI46704.1 DNA-binding response regulator, NarL/FixJ family, contains REC and HTH domains [Flavobacterium terrigena]
MSTTINIVLADDEVLFRKGISFLLQRETNFNIVFEANDGQELVDYLKSAKTLPDIVITDLKMPNLNGVETTKILHAEFPELKVIALTSYNTPSFISNMIQVGAVSYIVKNASPEEVVLTINEVANKGFYYNEEVMKVIYKDIISGKQTPKSDLDSMQLTSREIEILKLICKQYNAVEIAETLSISPRTAEGHRNNLLLKTQTKNIAGLVVYAIQNNIITLNEIDL